MNLPNSPKIKILMILISIALVSAVAVTVLSLERGERVIPTPSDSVVPQSEDGKVFPKPQITWSERQVEITLSPGESVSRDLKFTSSTALKKVTVEPVPEIAGFLSVQPSRFDIIPANQPQSVRVTFSIPPGTKLGTYEGTIHVKSGSQTLPQTLKVAISILSYTNSDLGLGFNIPSFGRPTKVALSQSSSGTQRIDIELQDDLRQGFVSTFRMIIYSNPAREDLQQWFQQTIDVNDILTTNGTFQQRQLENGLTSLIRTGFVPAQYLEEAGPVEEAYVMSPTLDRVIGIAQSQDNDLETLGYSQAATKELLIQILGSIQFF